MAKHRVVRSFRHEGVLYHNDNIHRLPTAELRSRIERGYVTGEHGEVRSSLEGVKFASVSAEEAAREAGLGAEAFANHEASSDRGYTVEDVRTITGG